MGILCQLRNHSHSSNCYCWECKTAACTSFQSKNTSTASRPIFRHKATAEQTWVFTHRQYLHLFTPLATDLNFVLQRIKIHQGIATIFCVFSFCVSDICVFAVSQCVWLLVVLAAFIIIIIIFIQFFLKFILFFTVLLVCILCVLAYGPLWSESN